MQKVLSVINIAKIKLKDPKKKDQRPRYNSETIHNWTKTF